MTGKGTTTHGRTGPGRADEGLARSGSGEREAFERSPDPDDPFAWEMQRSVTEDGAVLPGAAVAFQVDGKNERPTGIVLAHENPWMQGWMTAFVFAPTGRRDVMRGIGGDVVELVGFHVRYVTNWDHAEEYARTLVREAVYSLGGPTRGLTSREIRTAAAQSGLLAKARRLISESSEHAWFRAGAPLKRPVRDDGRGDRFFAQVAVDYALLAREGRGARARLAARRSVSDSTVRNWVTEAQKRGFWQSHGRGRIGDATPAAYEELGGWSNGDD